MIALRSPIFSAKRAEERLAEAPGEVLDRNGEGELGAGPVELHGDGKLEDAEGGADGKAHQHHEAAGEENGRDEGGTLGHSASLRRGRISVNRLICSIKNSRSIETVQEAV